MAEAMNEPMIEILILFFVIVLYAATRLELFDFSGNVGLSL